MNNLYISPEFEIIRVEILEEVLTGSLLEDNGGGGTVIDGDDWDSEGGGDGEFGDIFA